MWAPLATGRPRFGVGAGPRARPRPGDRPSPSVGRRGGLPPRSHIPALRVRREDEPAARVRDILGQPFSDAGAVTRHSSRVMKRGAAGGTRGSGEPGGEPRSAGSRTWERGDEKEKDGCFAGRGRPAHNGRMVEWARVGFRLPRGGLGSVYGRAPAPARAREITAGLSVGRRGGLPRHSHIRALRVDGRTSLPRGSATSWASPSLRPERRAGRPHAGA